MANRASYEKALGEIEAAKRKEIEKEQRRENLIKASNRRPAITKQIFAVYWSDQACTPTTIRSKWNQSHPDDKFDPGRRGRDDVKTAVKRGREFLTVNDVTAIELAKILGTMFGE